MEALSEELLTAWLRLTSAIDNQRLVYGLSFNEAVVCSLLERESRRGGFPEERMVRDFDTDDASAGDH